MAIPRKDTNPIAHALLNEFTSLKNVLSASHKDLMRVNGVKENSATLINLMGSMLNYCGRPDGDDVINSSKKGKEFASKYFVNVDVEQFYVFCLTKSNRLKKAVLINTGTSGEVSVQIRNITEVAIENKCDRIIVAHNHPCGKAIMSGQDCKFTYSLICSCILNNIELLDHIIVGTDRTISLFEQNILENLKKKAVDTIQISEEKRFFISEASKSYIKSIIDEEKCN
jgi:DNA repair protein RadC